MTRQLRDAGRTVAPDGSLLVWSVADGRRGRRWRAVSTRERTITHALLLEVDLAGRPARLELTTPAGMLTLHPEPDERSIHGNVVSPEGVRSLAFAWSPDHEIEIVDCPIATAVGLRRRRPSWAVGRQGTVPVLVIDEELHVLPGERAVARLEDDSWLITAPAARTGQGLTIDSDGIIASHERWPLEL